MDRILQDLNPWWRGLPALPDGLVPVERELFQDVFQRVLAADEYRAIMILGPRQAGKTTLAWQVIDRAIAGELPPQNILYADLGLDPFRGLSLFDLVRDRPPGAHSDYPTLFVLDEVHHCQTWAEELRVLVDRRKHRFLLTGSASRELLLGMEESLFGRYDRFSLYGLSLQEFALLRDTSRGLSVPLPPRQHLDPYLDRGGFPAHATTEDLRLIRLRIHEDVAMRAISHDIIARTSGLKGQEIRDDEGLRRLFVLLVQHPGAKLNLDRLSKDVGISPITANKWLRALQEAALLVRLPAITAAGREQRGKGRHPKVYPTDPGIAAAYTATGDLGRRAETAVLRHLLHAHDALHGTAPTSTALGYWQGGSRGELEIDFVLRHGGQTLAVEVTTEAPVSEEKIRISTRAVRAMEERPARCVLLSMELEPRKVTVEDCSIEILPLDAFLLACSRPSSLFSIQEL